jgi:hypothetical protein
MAANCVFGVDEYG